MTEQTFPEPTVGALVFNQEGKMFLMKSHKFYGKYVVPGGHIELGETIEQALKRELKEETGMDVFGFRFIGIQELVFDKAFWKKKHFIFLDYACKTNSTEVKLNEEAQSFIWVTPNEALYLDVEPYTRNTIKEFICKFPEGI